MAKTSQNSRARQTARFVEPMQCLAVAKLPEGPDWEYEIKFDGYRALGLKTGHNVRPISRNGNDFSGRFPSIARALSKLPDDTVVDGEIVALRNGFVPALRVKIFERLHGLEIRTCPFSNLPQRDKGRWGQGLTADKMAECRWLKPQFVAQIEYADWTDVTTCGTRSS